MRRIIRTPRRDMCTTYPVMRGLDPRIHVFGSVGDF